MIAVATLRQELSYIVIYRYQLTFFHKTVEKSVCKGVNFRPKVMSDTKMSLFFNK